MFWILGLILAVVGIYFMIVGSLILGLVLLVLGIIIMGYGAGHGRSGYW